MDQLDVNRRRRRRRHVLSWFHPTPSFPQTAGSHADPARRPPHSVVHMAGLRTSGYRRWLCATTGGVPERAPANDLCRCQPKA